MESSNQEENGYVSEEDVAKDKFERTELVKNMRRHTCSAAHLKLKMNNIGTPKLENSNPTSGHKTKERSRFPEVGF